MDTSQFYHIRTHLNPADVISRGTTPNKLLDLPLYWKGPDFIYEKDLISQLNRLENFNTIEEIREETKVLIIQKPEDDDITERFGSYNRLIRVIATILRWRHKNKGDFTIEELERAEKAAVRIVQGKYLADIIKGIKNKSPLRKEIAVLTPFIQ